MPCKQSYQHPGETVQHELLACPHAGRDLLLVRNQYYTEVWGRIIAQPEHWKTHRKRRQTGCGENDETRGEKEKEERKKKEPSLAGWSTACFLGGLPDRPARIQATCINSWLTWLTCARCPTVADTGVIDFQAGSQRGPSWRKWFV